MLMLPVEVPAPPLSCWALQPPSDSIELTDSAYDGIDVDEVVETLMEDFTLMTTSVTQAVPDPHDLMCSVCVPVEDEMLLSID
jgi:hypothetical protein